jgi:hypothetical protein
MEREALRETLARLNAELEEAGPIDAPLRADLERTLAEIREAIERDARRAGQEPSLKDRLEEFALHFEQSHPLLSEAISNVVNALARMGI